MEEIKEEKNLEFNENENVMCQKLCDIMKALLSGKGLQKIDKN